MKFLLLLLACLSLSLTACHRPQTAFSGDASLAYVKTQLDFGPRVPGTPAHRRTGDWIIEQMKQRADTVVVQSWSHVTAKGDTLPLRNILARINPSATQRVLYVTHWDTRPTADEDMNLGNKGRPIPGANDGASGVALLMGIADALKKTMPIYGVDLLFVDGEDYGSFDGYLADSALTKKYDVLIGSTYFANHLPSPDYKPIFGVLFDMIGDKSLQIDQESNSVDAAPEVVTRVWSTADELGYGKYFIGVNKGGVTDDHVPLLKRGLRVIDVIDDDYCSDGSVGCEPGPNNLHHTTQDTFDKVSARSLQAVGDVAVALVTR
ncbi:MAG TPA: M28 family peptidase [Gemmatimonadaceae bacterium]|nr:M28 family peptidase [Gemmatimonadaceae bacterium]